MGSRRSFTGENVSNFDREPNGGHTVNEFFAGVRNKRGGKRVEN